MSANRSPYSQLQPEDRLTIASLLQQRYSVRGIARVLGRCTSTISREIARNSVSGQGYASTPAQQRSENKEGAAQDLSPSCIRKAFYGNWSFISCAVAGHLSKLR